MNTHQVVARNYSAASENKIHSDEIARRYGFRGALVPGVAVFGHLSFPLTERLGTDWLGASQVETRFLKPAYDGERLDIGLRRDDAGVLEARCHNAGGELLATLTCDPVSPLPPVDAAAGAESPTGTMERVEIDWASIHPGEPFPTVEWTPTPLENEAKAEQLDDMTAAFRDGVLHPHAILSEANQALVRRFILPAWIHVGSEMRFRRRLRVGDTIAVHAVPLERWARKGHELVKLYVALVCEHEVATEIFHTAIFRVAEK